MRLGIFAKTFRDTTLDGILQKISVLEIRAVHFNLACLGLESLPAELCESQCRAVQDYFRRHELTMCSVSGTYNTIHPDRLLRAEWTRRACLLIERCSALGTRLVTLCTGTRHPDDMWTHHPSNREPSAWNDLTETLTQLIRTAERHQVFLGIEPEQANVIHSAVAARRLLDQFRSPQLKIVLDGANLLHSGNRSQMETVFAEAVALLGDDVILAHAKDYPRHPGGSRAPGQGVLNWGSYLKALTGCGFHGPLVVHGLTEAEVPTSISFLKAQCHRIGCINPAKV